MLQEWDELLLQSSAKISEASVGSTWADEVLVPTFPAWGLGLELRAYGLGP